MSQFAQELADLAILLFVISSMFGMGLNLTVSQIFTPLRPVSLIPDRYPRDIDIRERFIQL